MKEKSTKEGALERIKRISLRIEIINAYLYNIKTFGIGSIAPNECESIRFYDHYNGRGLRMPVQKLRIIELIISDQAKEEIKNLNSAMEMIKAVSSCRTDMDGANK